MFISVLVLSRSQLNRKMSNLINLYQNLFVCYKVCYKIKITKTRHNSMSTRVIWNGTRGNWNEKNPSKHAVTEMLFFWKFKVFSFLKFFYYFSFIIFEITVFMCLQRKPLIKKKILILLKDFNLTFLCNRTVIHHTNCKTIHQCNCLGCFFYFFLIFSIQ
jgi:hypothetical protein